MTVAIKLVENLRERAILERTPRYDVMFFGNRFWQVHYNMRGYIGYLPCPPDPEKVGFLDIGEKGISAFKKEISKLNKEWKEFMELNPSWIPTAENRGRDVWKPYL